MVAFADHNPRQDVAAENVELRYGAGVVNKWTMLFPLLAAGACSSDPSLEGVVFNEVEATIDFIELFNAGVETIPLGGYKLADEGNDGGPRADRALVFPDDLELEAGGYLLVVANRGADATDGWQTDCLPDGPARCLHASWGVSKNGERLFVLSPDDIEVLSIDVPAGVAAEGRSYGRLPDGSGELTSTVPTPGRANQGP